jgi:hypothetical protein
MRLTVLQLLASQSSSIFTASLVTIVTTKFRHHTSSSASTDPSRPSQKLTLPALAYPFPSPLILCSSSARLARCRTCLLQLSNPTFACNPLLHTQIWQSCSFKLSRTRRLDACQAALPTPKVRTNPTSEHDSGKQPTLNSGHFVSSKTFAIRARQAHKVQVHHGFGYLFVRRHCLAPFFALSPFYRGSSGTFWWFPTVHRRISLLVCDL